MNRETCRRLIQVILPLLLATTALATETDPCPKLEVVPTGSQGNAVALASTGTGGTEVQTAEAIPEEGGDWKAEKPVAVTGKALTKFAVTPSDYEVIATLWHKLDSPSAQATAQTNGAGELKLRLVAQEGAPVLPRVSSGNFGSGSVGGLSRLFLVRFLQPADPPGP